MVAVQGDKTFGVYAYYWKGSRIPFYIGKDSHIDLAVRDNQHRTSTPAKTIIDKAIQGKGKTGLRYEVIAKYPNEIQMTLGEALLIDYWKKRNGCKANIVNELYSNYNRKKFWGDTVVDIPKPPVHRIAEWIKRGSE